MNRVDNRFGTSFGFVDLSGFLLKAQHICDCSQCSDPRVEHNIYRVPTDWETSENRRVLNGNFWDEIDKFSTFMHTRKLIERNIHG